MLLAWYMPKNSTFDSAAYQEVLRDLRAAIGCKWPKLQDENVILMHDNIQPHTSTSTIAFLCTFRWEIFSQLTYSPEVSPSDYWLFPKLKESLASQRLRWITKQRKQFWISSKIVQWYLFFTTVIKWLVLYHSKCLNLLHHSKCLNLLGEYVEK